MAGNSSAGRWETTGGEAVFLDRGLKREREYVCDEEKKLRLIRDKKSKTENIKLVSVIHTKM